MKKILVIMLLAAFGTVPVRADEPGNQAELGQLNGDVQVYDADLGTWTPGSENLPLEAGDRVRVPPDGEAEIILSENVLTFLDGENDVSIDAVGSDSGQLTVNHGTLLGRVTPSGRAQAWEFHTPTTVAAIRGTEFCILAPQSGDTHLGVFEGDVEMRPAQAPAASAVHVLTNHEVVLTQGALKMQPELSPAVKAHLPHIAMMRRRQVEVRSRWEPRSALARQKARHLAAVYPRRHPPRQRMHHHF